MRERWDSRSAFVLAAIGSAIGLGNVWRFPYIAYQNGGGAFLIPYFVAMITAGIPLLILEFGLGHKMSGSAPFSFARIAKRYEWIGWFALLIAFGIVTYYAVIMGWCFGYLYHAFSLAWGKDVSSFFYKDFLHLSSGIGEIGGINPHILIGLALTWIAIYFCIIKGVKSVGRVVLITVPLPWLCLIILAIRGITLPGALEGIKYYLTPNFAALTRPQVWLAAYAQIFFSLSIGFGIMIAYASYLPKNSDINNNAVITGFSNCLTSYIAGFAVFSSLGYLALMTKKSVADVAAGGPGLAFISYPTIINLLPFGAAVFGVIFFLMLLTLGIDSAFSLVEAAVAGGMDRWRISRKVTNIAVCVIGFLGGLIYTTDAGLYILDVVDHFLSNFGLVLVGLLECLIIGYVLKAKVLREYVNSISEFRLGPAWDFSIRFLTPGVLILLLSLNLIERIKSPYGGYPGWIGWVVLLLIFIIALLFARIGRSDVD
ncbi:sodium-dependent transporter [candidate division WOR-3 bacterium]|uniref:Transporter n=1 Tax=candidate division WOR-3 bacterium TaxID=2052148 RepID=A0A660SM03_UNCW3|nr:MAG: sodium-dependent transporter [candidate division WOR-3 bacterium]